MDNKLTDILERIEVTMTACAGISTHALKYGVVYQLRNACSDTLRFLMLPEISHMAAGSRKRELLISQLSLVLSKLSDPEPEKGE